MNRLNAQGLKSFWRSRVLREVDFADEYAFANHFTRFCWP
jgi:hypothetical protein